MAGSEREIENSKTDALLAGEKLEEANASEKVRADAIESLPSAERSKLAQQSKDLASEGKLGHLQLVDSERLDGNSEEDHEHDSLDSVEVGNKIYWKPETRENARPQEGEGYHDVMRRVGRELLGRPLLEEELKLLVQGAQVMQGYRGKDASHLTVHDELLPKNYAELEVFLNGLEEPRKGPLSERQVKELSKNLFETFQNNMVPPADGALVYDLRPVKDQPIVTQVVPSAVYIDSSHIEGGQGFRRKENCQSETQEYWLSKVTAESLMRAQKWLIANGHEPIVLRNMNAAGRRALDRELIKKCAPNQPHAKKRSQHEDGISIDVDNYDNQKVREALTREGFVHNVPGDRPHFTWFAKKK